MIHPVALRLGLMVVAAFAVVIVVWVVVIALAGTVDTHRLSPSEEAGLLREEGAR
jgi:hypothetical protein